MSPCQTLDSTENSYIITESQLDTVNKLRILYDGSITKIDRLRHAIAQKDIAIKKAEDALASGEGVLATQDSLILNLRKQRAEYKDELKDAKKELEKYERKAKFRAWLSGSLGITTTALGILALVLLL